MNRPDQRNFLQRVVEVALASGLPELKNTTIVFANKRAGLYFMNELARMLGGKPGWAPEVLSFEELVNKVHPDKKTDRFTLVYYLYEVYNSIYKRNESLENFYFWGEMLLKDFEEIDHQLVSPDDLFKNLKDYREIEAISYLDEQQIEIIRRFWKLDESAKYTEEWVRFWEKLGKVYYAYQEKVKEKGESYYGRQIRLLSHNLDNVDVDSRRYVFAGFNALTKSELKIIEHFMKSPQNSIIWDYDKYYLQSNHEAGRYLRSNRRNEYFAKFFNYEGHSGLTDSDKKISIFSTSTEIAQVKLLAKRIQELASSEDWVPEKTVIVLPNEKQLFPVLNSLSDNIEAFNITMGLNLTESFVYEIYDHLVKLEKSKKIISSKSHYAVKKLLELFRHPLFRKINPNLENQLKEHSLKEKQYWYSWDTISEFDKDLEQIIDFDQGENFLKAVIKNIEKIFDRIENKFDRVFFNKFLEILHDLNETIEQNNLVLSLDGLHKLIRRSSAIHKVQFSGEPVKGLQIMGVLETRNVDFDHVFILNMNEDYFPGPGNIQSFIPQSLRRAFGMQTMNDNQSIQSYVFYRLIQRCKDVNLYYNAMGESNGGDTSRFIHQITYSFPVKPTFYIHEQNLKSSQKTINLSGEKIYAEEVLKKYLDGGDRYLSPSALHTYLECGLRFYFKYILNLKVKEEPEDEVDARIFGNLVHKSIEACYKVSENQYRDISEISDKWVEEVIEKIMVEEMGSSNKEEGKWKGKHLIARTMLSKTLTKLIENDRKEDNVSIYAFEGRFKSQFGVNGIKVNLAGLIDRLDYSENRFRVIDYKTGGDSDTLSSFDDFLTGNKKAVFQLFLYSWLFYKNNSTGIRTIKPVVYRTKAVFDSAYNPCIKYNKSVLEDIIPLLDEFEEFLRSIMKRIFTLKEFEATENPDFCKYCDFKEICRK